MRQLRGVLVAAEGLIGFQAVLVVVGVSLEFEEEVVGESVWGVPGMADVDFLVLSVYFLADEAVMFDVVDDFEHGDSSEGCNECIEKTKTIK